MIFVDTTAFVSLVSVRDMHNEQASYQWQSFIQEGQPLCTNNYVAVESIAVIQKRLGVRQARLLQTSLLSFVQVEWLNESSHVDALEFWLSASRRRLSLVDCAAIQTMRRLRVDTAFTFDNHFRQQGFKVIP
jgi:predicted nucleic acid-binding protein